MNKITIQLMLLFVLAFTGCKKEADTKIITGKPAQNQVKYASGLKLYQYDNYTVVKVTQPWPEAKEGYTYVMHKKGVTLPDSLKDYTAVQVPLQSVVVTSTTHIPSLEMLNRENTLTSFPGTDYISSEKVRKLIDTGKVKEAGKNETLNTETIIDLAPDAVVGFSVSSSNKALTALERSGIKVLYNGDWTEQTPLGKAEWIKFFGALYGLEDEASRIFDKIVKDYTDAMAPAMKLLDNPTVLSGAMYQDQWYMPQGGSWAALFLKDAGADYLWKDAKGTGSLNLGFETVLDKATNADVWIGPGQFTSLQEMLTSNPHYAQFKAFKNQQVYSFAVKKGATGGVLYYELAPNRPDLVLKDLIKILHPKLLPDYELHFFEKLQ